MALTEEHSEDFRLDPLLNIHIHHNLAEILLKVTNCPSQLSSNGEQLHENSEKGSKLHSIEKCDMNVVKRRKVSGEHDSDCTDDAENTVVLSKYSLNGDQAIAGKSDVSSMPFSEGLLRATCEELKQKYLSVFTAKLFMAQEDFRKSYRQVYFLQAVT